MATHTYVNLEIDEARYLANLVGAAYDLETTIDWCNRFDTLVSDREHGWLIEPMTTAILVRFVRAFGRGARYPDTKHILSALPKEKKEQYEYYKLIRDKHAAHSVNEFEDNHVKAYYIEGEANKGINSIGLGCNRVIGLSSNDVDNIRGICQILMSKVSEEMDNEKKKLMNLTAGYTEQDILKFEMKSPRRLKDIDVAKTRK